MLGVKLDEDDQLFTVIEIPETPQTVVRFFSSKVFFCSFFKMKFKMA